MLQRVVERLLAVVDDVVIVGLRRDHVIAGATFVADLRPGLGPLGGLVTGLRAVKTDAAIALGCDMPQISPPVLRYLVEMSLADGSDAVIPRVARQAHPLYAVYRKSALVGLEAQLKETRPKLRSLQASLNRMNVRWVEEATIRKVDPYLNSFISVDTPTEWHDFLSHNHEGHS